MVQRWTLLLLQTDLPLLQGAGCRDNHQLNQGYSLCKNLH